MDRDLTEKETEILINCGALGYDAKLISSIIDIPETEIKKHLQDDRSVIYKLYNKGVVMAQYVIDLKLFEMAKSGDLNAITRYENRKTKRNTK